MSRRLISIALAVAFAAVLAIASPTVRHSSAVLGADECGGNDPQAKPGVLTRDLNARLSTAGVDPQIKSGAPAAAAAVRPPAVPLITHDPYFSIWSMADRLTDEWPKHWTGKPNGMMAMALVDGKPFRLMGPEWRRIPALTQTSLRVTPTRTN